MTIYEKVWQYNPELLGEADELAEKDKTSLNELQSKSVDISSSITLELVQQWWIGTSVDVYWKIGNGKQ